jgi:hypothetical protein
MTVFGVEEEVMKKNLVHSEELRVYKHIQLIEIAGYESF